MRTLNKSYETERIQGEIDSLQGQITDPQQDMMGYEEFLNVAKNADLYLKAANIAAKDRITRLIYLNVTVDDQNVVDCQIREPFKTYFQMHKILAGRQTNTADEPILDLRKIRNLKPVRWIPPQLLLVFP